MGNLPPAFSGLKPLGPRVHPIQANEFHERLLRAQKLMSELAPKCDALFFAPGTSALLPNGNSLGDERAPPRIGTTTDRRSHR